MLQKILSEKNISLYALARESGIPYTTLNDLLNGRTAIENVSASVLYKLSVSLDMTMEELYLGSRAHSVFYLYNRGREVYIESGDVKLQYLGPKNLVAFRHIRKFREGVVYADTYFEDESGRIYQEEDYIDLQDLLEEYEYDPAVLSDAEVRIGPPSRSRREELIDEALLVSDYMAILNDEDNSTKDIHLEVVSLARPSAKLTLRLRDYAILSTNMGNAMKQRAVESVKRNRELIITEMEERQIYA